MEEEIFIREHKFKKTLWLDNCMLRAPFNNVSSRNIFKPNSFIKNHEL